jgi:hypothetical protein
MLYSIPKFINHSFAGVFMQKINPVRYALLILGLSGASLAYSATPEAIATALNFCQERFNTSDKDECKKIIDAKVITTLRQSFDVLARNNFTDPTDPQELAQMKKDAEESRILSQHLSALRNDPFTPIENLEMYIKLLARTIKRCNKQVEGKDLMHCIVDGALEDVKMVINTEYAVRSSQDITVVAFFNESAKHVQAALEQEIGSRQFANKTEQSATEVSVSTLQDIVEQLKASRAKLAHELVVFVPVATANDNPDATAPQGDAQKQETDKSADTKEVDDKEIHD